MGTHPQEELTQGETGADSPEVGGLWGGVGGWVGWCGKVVRGPNGMVRITDHTSPYHKVPLLTPT